MNLCRRTLQPNGQSCLIFCAHALPKSFIIHHQSLVIDLQLGSEGAATAGITVQPLRDAEIFLGQRLQRKPRKEHPCCRKFSTRLANLKTQAPNRQRIGAWTPAQIDIESSAYRWIFAAVLIPTDRKSTRLNSSHIPLSR